MSCRVEVEDEILQQEAAAEEELLLEKMKYFNWKLHQNKLKSLKVAQKSSG